MYSPTSRSPLLACNPSQKVGSLERSGSVQAAIPGRSHESMTREGKMGAALDCSGDRVRVPTSTVKSVRTDPNNEQPRPLGLLVGYYFTFGFLLDFVLTVWYPPKLVQGQRVFGTVCGGVLSQTLNPRHQSSRKPKTTRWPSSYYWPCPPERRGGLFWTISSSSPPPSSSFSSSSPCSFFLSSFLSPLRRGLPRRAL